LTPWPSSALIHPLPELIRGSLSNGAHLTCGRGVLGWRLLMDRDYLADGPMTVQEPQVV
jgi:hypothetical protein